MIRLGITGSIAMGKTTTANILRHRGIAVFDSDAEVARLYQDTDFAQRLSGFLEIDSFLDTNGRIDRKALSQAIRREPEMLARLETFVHPLVIDGETEFFNAQRQLGAMIAATDTPLLLESNGKGRVDKLIVVSASHDTQIKRLKSRGYESEELISTLIARQMPDSEKRLLADFIIDSEGGISCAEQQIDQILDKLGLNRQQTDEQ